MIFFGLPVMKESSLSPFVLFCFIFFSQIVHFVHLSLSPSLHLSLSLSFHLSLSLSLFLHLSLSLLLSGPTQSVCYCSYSLWIVSATLLQSHYAKPKLHLLTGDRSTHTRMGKLSVWNSTLHPNDYSNEPKDRYPEQPFKWLEVIWMSETCFLAVWECEMTPESQ